MIDPEACAMMIPYQEINVIDFLIDTNRTLSITRR